MNDNEKLIEEALIAYWGTEKTAKFYGSAEGMRAALDVFEKAHAPTDDDREARLEYVIDAAVPVDDFPSWRFRYSRRIAEAVRGAGFRLPETPEPIAERCYWCNSAARGAAAWQGDGDRYASCGQEGHGSLFAPSVPQSEPSDAQVEAALLRFNERPHEVSWDAMRAALRAARSSR